MQQKGHIAAIVATSNTTERDVRDLRRQCQRLSKTNEELKAATDIARAEVRDIETIFASSSPCGWPSLGADTYYVVYIPRCGSGFQLTHQEC